MELWSESGAQLFVVSTATGSLSTDTTECFLLLLLLVSSGSVMGDCLSLSPFCCGIQCWTVYCRILLSSPPTTVTVFGSAGHFFDDFPFSLTDSSVVAVTHRLGLMEAACCRCLNVLFNDAVSRLHCTVSMIDQWVWSISRMVLQGLHECTWGKKLVTVLLCAMQIHIDWPVFKPGSCMCAVGILCNLSDWEQDLVHI